MEVTKVNDVCVVASAVKYLIVLHRQEEEEGESGIKLHTYCKKNKERFSSEREYER